MFKSPRRNGRKKRVKIKHVIQISMLLGVSIWLIYEIHNTDDKKSSVRTANSHNLNNDSGKDIGKLGRKVLRPKVKGNKEDHHHHNQSDDEQNNENKESENGVEEVGDNEHKDDEKDEDIKERGNEKDGYEESGKIQRIQSEEFVEKLKENRSNEQNKAVVMDDIAKKSSSNVKEDDEDEDGDQIVNERVEEDTSSSKRARVNHGEENVKKQSAQQKNSAPLSYSYETNTANYMKLTGNQEHVKAKYELKDDELILEEEKDAFTDLETLQDGALLLKMH